MAALAAASQERLDDTADAIAEFLEVAIHLILFVREVYPPQLFERRKKYDLPVRMSKHPELNSYIAEIVRGAHAALKQGDLHKLVVAIVEEEGAREVVERFVFEIASWTALGAHAEAVESEFRAFLLRINVLSSVLSAPAKGTTFRVLLYTNQFTDEQRLAWVPAERPAAIVDPRLYPVRSMDTAPVQMQLFVEERPVAAKAAGVAAR